MSILPKLGDRDRAILNSIFNPSLPLGELEYNQFEDEALEDPSAEAESADIIEMELNAIKLAEDGKYDESLKLFLNLVDKNQERAATYNNRAQVYRLMGNIAAAYGDLTKAIELGNGIGVTCRQAFCQRGVLQRKDGKDDEARADFQQAAKLGSKFAKQQLVEMNPYAALCNQMLSKAMEQLNQ